MKLSELLAGTGVKPPCGDDPVITSLEDDSRKVRENSLFVAVTGYATDGHLYLRQAIENGAAAVIAESAQPELPAALVNPSGDNRSLLAELAARFYRYPWNEMVTVGITGTNGKTSTARMLAWIMEGEGVPTGILGTVGHVIGGRERRATVTTPGSLETTALMEDMRESGDGACVMEVSSHALSMARVDAVRYDAALFTNISQDHLDHHGSMEEYLKCKLRIFDLLKNDGCAVVGTYAEGYPTVSGALTFGTDPASDYRVHKISIGQDGTGFTLTTAKADFEVRLPPPGRFNAYNAAGAIAVASELGIDPAGAAGHLSRFPGVPGRFEVVDMGQEFLVAVDYAHTPDALERVLGQGAELRGNGRLISVFGTGGDRDRKKRPIMGGIASRLSDITVVTSDNPRTEDPGRIIEDVLTGIPRSMITDGSVLVEPDRRTAIRTAIEMARTGDVVVIAGKGHEDYQILGTTRIHFDDREEAREVIGEVMVNASR